jgi:hypothetical protein
VNTVKKSETNQEAPGENQTAALAERQVFLLTIYKSKKNRQAGVYLQASHQAGTHKFKDLASTFAYLEGLEQQNHLSDPNLDDP